jgi:FkbH-like protein
MKYYIFRNTTIELLFQKIKPDYSDYGDVLNFDQSFDRYIFFYNLINKTDSKLILSEIDSYKKMIHFIINKMDTNKLLILFTLGRIYKLNFSNSDNTIEKAIFNFNQELNLLESHNTNIKVLKINDFYDEFSSDSIIDWKYNFTSKIEISPTHINEFNFWFSNQIRSIELKRKKCLVLDLDNTLWGGVLGEDGIDGILIGNNYPGNAFLFFQEALLELKKSGVILTVCSKNNEEDVFELWEKHSDIILKKNDFIIHKINWKNKAENILEISNELNIGLDSMVFIDDNPTEREFVKKSLPELNVPIFPEEPYLLPVFFKYILNNFFSVHNLTSEDLNKSKQYLDNNKRQNFYETFNNIDKFISELNINLIIEKLNDSNVSRFSQMTQKTNQFNLTTKRYSEVDINSFRNNSEIFGLRVKDKFGDSGITGLVILKLNNDEAYIDSFLLSCRILGKRIEFEFMNYILLKLIKMGVKKVTAEYIPTKKNIQTIDFFEKFNFECIHDTENIKKYYLKLNKQKYKLSPQTYKLIDYDN